MDRPEEGVTALSGDLEWAGYASARHEAEGDLLYQLNRLDEARQAYQLAVNTSSGSAAPGLTMKVEDLTYLNAGVEAPEVAAEPVSETASDTDSSEADSSEAVSPEAAQSDEDTVTETEDAP
jgi:hypothetical protein